jgi:glycerol-3-phosphate dehydrogenase
MCGPKNKLGDFAKYFDTLAPDTSLLRPVLIPTSLPRRHDLIASLRSDPHVDVVIIGGGINGISTLRELALAGVRAVVVERHDFAGGASAGSSHMIHGGIRYLENGEVRLVKESLTERNRLLDNAPHYVKPLGTTIPIFSTFSGIISAPLRLLTHRAFSTKERGALLIKIGLVLYDLFGRKKGTLPPHEFHGKKKSLRNYPAMNHEVRYTAHYSDACIEQPERLAVELLSDALSAGDHVRAVNYVEAVSMTADGGLVVKDHLSDSTLTLSPKVIINASGPWVDLTNQALGRDTTYMGGTKGSHIVVDNPALHEACRGREVFFENDDGRIVLILPLLGKVLVGTTDVPIDNPDDARCTDEEIDYFIQLAGHVFPEIPIDRSQIVYRYTGVRPLPAAGDLTPGLVSRDYRITIDNVGPTLMLSLVGGKWTTFRALGEHLAESALDLLGRTREHSTINTAIGGGVGFPRTEAERSRWIEQNRGTLTALRMGELLSRYGTKAANLAAEIGDSGENPLETLPDYSREEVGWLVRSEWVTSLSDLTHRRTPLAFTGKLTSAARDELAKLVGAELGWSGKERTQQAASAALGLSD